MIIAYDTKYQQQALDLGRQMHQESKFRNWHFDENRIRQLITAPQACVLLSVEKDKVTGFFVGVVTSFWFGPDLTGYDLAMYIDPDHRGGTTAMRFVKRFEEFCKQRGCVSITLGSSAEIATETAQRLYEGLGYNTTGFLASKEL